MPVFYTGAVESGTIVVVPEVQIHNHLGVRVGTNKGDAIRLKFQRGLIDTEALARKHKWTPEQHTQVVDHIRSLDNFGMRGRRGITEDTQIAYGDPAKTKRCVMFWLENGSHKVCGSPVFEDTEYCDRHQPAPVEVPVEEVKTASETDEGCTFYLGTGKGTCGKENVEDHVLCKEHLAKVDA